MIRKSCPVFAGQLCLLKSSDFVIARPGKGRGNLVQAVPNSPKTVRKSKQFCEIATAASGLAMTNLKLF